MHSGIGRGGQTRGHSQRGLFDGAAAHGQGREAVLAQQGLQGAEVGQGVCFGHVQRMQVDDHRIVVEKIGHVAKTLGEFLRQQFQVGRLEHQSDQRQVGALDFEGGGRVSCEGDRHGRNRSKNGPAAGTPGRQVWL